MPIRFAITAAGNVGIGTSSPRTSASGVNKTLDIKGGIYFGDTNSESCTINNDDSMIFNIDANNSSTSNFFRFATNTTLESGGTELMRITEAGDVFIGTDDPNATNTGMALLRNGEIDISRNSGTNFVMNRNTTNGQIIVFRFNNTDVGSISTNANSLPSDLNFKKDISDISIGLNLVTKLRPVHYRHKMDEDNEPLSNGIIAQEMEEALSECGVENNSLLMLQHKPNEKENESQYWVDYTKMIPVLVKAIQELKTQNDALQSRIETLEQK
jgi:hypothetical protein